MRRGIVLYVNKQLECMELCLGMDEELTELVGQHYREGRDTGCCSWGLLQAT